MKKILNISLLSLLLVGCTKNRDIAPGERPEERMGAAMTELKANILQAPHGWKGELATAQNNGFAFYFDFNDQDRVVSVSDINEETASTPFESGYRLRAVMAASLLFDTYSYIHLLADPNPAVAGGTVTQGYSSDFEFEYNGVSKDSLVMVGKKRRSHFRMVPATAEEKSQYMSGQLRASMVGFNTFIANNPNLYFEINPNIRPAFLFNTSSKKVVIAWKEDNADKFIEVPYLYTLTGVRFPTDAVIGNARLTHIEMSSATSAQAKMLDGTTYEMGNFTTPLLPLSLIFNYNGVFSVIGTPSDQLPAIAANSSFTTVWNSTTSNFVSSGRAVRYFELVMTNSNTVTFNLYYAAGTSNFTATVTFGYSYENGLLILKNPSGHTAGNWNTRIAQIRPLHDFLLKWATEEVPLQVQWIPSADGSVVAGLISTANPDDILYGTVR